MITNTILQTPLTWNVLTDVVPDAVGVVHIVPSEGTEEDGEGELEEVLDGLLDPEVVGGVGVVVVVWQLRGGQSPDIDDRTAHRTREGSDQDMLTLGHQLVPQLDQVLQGLDIDEGRLLGVVEGSLQMELSEKIKKMFSHLEAHDVLHAEAVHGVLVVVVSGVTISCIEVIVHQTVPNHDVVRVQ